MMASEEEQPQKLTQPAYCPPWLTGSHQHLLQRHQQGKLPHALLICGSAELGKLWFAQNLVRVLLCQSLTTDEPLSANVTHTACGKCAACTQLRAGSSTEFRYLQPAGKSHTIRIDAVRELVDWLQLSANASRYRVALISGADTMNRAAANAFLKTLEEPASRTLCILVADRPGQLPATLLSRCQQLNLSVDDESAAVDWLVNQLGARLSVDLDSSAGADTGTAPKVGVNPVGGAPEELAQRALRHARGAPLRAVREAEPGWQSQRQTIDAAWWNLFLHRRSVGAIVESLKEVPLDVCLSRFLTLCVDAVRHRQGAAEFSAGPSLSDEQSIAVDRFNNAQWFTIHDNLQRLHRIDSASFKTQTVLEGFLADTRLKIKG